MRGNDEEMDGLKHLAEDKETSRRNVIVALLARWSNANIFPLINVARRHVIR